MVKCHKGPIRMIYHRECPQRLLLIDDDPTFSGFIAQGLERAGLSMSVAPTGQSGLDALQATRFSLVLLDLVLPDINGLDLLRRLRSSRHSPPVLLISGLGTIRSAVDAIRLGALDFIEKPLNIEDLVDVIRSHLSLCSRDHSFPDSPLEIAFGRSIYVVGVPAEYFALLWAALVYWSARLRRNALPGARAWSTNVDWWLGTLGLSGVIYLVQVLGQARIQEVSVSYLVAAVSVVIVFASSCLVGREEDSSENRVRIAQVFAQGRSPVGIGLFLTAIALILWGPRSSDRPETGPGFERWYAQQQPIELPADLRPKPITLLEFVDYQCPACAARALEYGPVLDRLSATLGERFAHVRLDFPLDFECNEIGVLPDGSALHDAACESAVAVRAARRLGPGQEQEMVQWLWQNQSALTPEMVLERLENLGGPAARAGYSEVVQAVSLDVAIGRRLGVVGTPAYFLNGRRLPPLSAASLEAAIQYESRLIGRP